MQFSVTFRHMEASDALREYARDKVTKIKKYFPDPIMTHVVMSTERGYQHMVDVNIQLHNGIIIKGSEVTEDMYSSIDLVMAKIERQVRRYKEKIRGHQAREDLSTIPVAYSVLAQNESETEQSKRIIKTEQRPAQRLTADEAIMQMDLLGASFLVFTNSQHGRVNVVYKMDDGTYGLIEPGPATTP